MKYIKRLFLLGLIASIGLSSCQVVNKYKSPDIDTEGLFRDENPTDTTTIANIPWREYFSDPLLRTLIEEGLQSNFDMLIAYQRVKQAEAGVSMAVGAYFPSVALAGQVEHQRISMGAKGKDVLGYELGTSFGLGVAVTWEADLWGKINRQYRAQAAQLMSTHAYRNLIQTSLVANIATTYYSLMALDEQLRVTEETIELLKETTATIEALKESGAQNEAGVEQSRALAYSTQVSIPDLKKAIRETENALCVMLGRKPGPITRSTIAEQAPLQTVEVGIPVQMLAMRPDVRQAEYAFKNAFELTNVARASFYPSITLNAGSMLGYASNSLSDFFNPKNILANILGGITQPLFAQNKLRANLKSSKAEEAATLLTFQKTVLQASQEVSNLLFGYEASLSKNEVRANQVESLRKSVYYTQELLKSDMANYLEVIQAEQNYLQARLSQINDKLEQLTYSVNLYRALGGGTK